MDNAEQNANQFVFGLDIGTRNVVGTVGYREGKDFYVAAQYMKEHETRAMLDGQIHDIGRVGRTIAEVKAELEGQLEAKLTDVCIAAAGRVLKTVTTSVEYEFAEETVVTAEHIHTLDLLGVDHAQQILKERNDTRYKFYCVGYSVVKYYINDDVFSNESSGQFLGQLLHDKFKKVVLGHLSKENNLAELAYETVRQEVEQGENPYHGNDFPIQVAKRDEVSELIRI